MREVQIGDTLMNYELTYKNVKNINLRIKPNGSIVVSANSNIPVNKIDDFIISKGKYIFKTLNKFKELEQFVPKQKKYISGEGFRILGRDLRLKVLQGNKESIEFDGIYIFLTIKNKNDFKKKSILVNRFINDYSQDVLGAIVNEVYGKFQKYSVLMPKIRIRDMKSRWGSCQPKRCILTFNTRLVEAPRNCIEYVVLHEFCHFIHPNHSKKFYAFVGMMMPDWKERKKTLEKSFYFNK